MLAVGLHTCTAVARSLCVSWAFLLFSRWKVQRHELSERNQLALCKITSFRVFFFITKTILISLIFSQTTKLWFRRYLSKPKQITQMPQLFARESFAAILDSLRSSGLAYISTIMQSTSTIKQHSYYKTTTNDMDVVTGEAEGAAAPPTFGTGEQAICSCSPKSWCLLHFASTVP